MAHGELSYAAGPAIDRLTKSGVVLASSKSEGNTKEATVERTADGHWRLFYEYAADGASRVGLAVGADCAGPWDEQPPPFAPRPDSWDNWHLSTGPLLLTDPEMPVMFYNGATQDARWRIGWVAFDRGCTRVVARGIEPLITPPRSPTAARPTSPSRLRWWPRMMRSGCIIRWKIAGWRGRGFGGVRAGVSFGVLRRGEAASSDGACAPPAALGRAQISFANPSAASAVVGAAGIEPATPPV